MTTGKIGIGPVGATGVGSIITGKTGPMCPVGATGAVGPINKNEYLIINMYLKQIVLDNFTLSTSWVNSGSPLWLVSSRYSRHDNVKLYDTVEIINERINNNGPSAPDSILSEIKRILLSIVTGGTLSADDIKVYNEKFAITSFRNLIYDFKIRNRLSFKQAQEILKSHFFIEPIHES
jgi:hypothetical protein